MSVHVDLHLQRQNFELKVAFTAPPSGITGIFGPSGCGKTTLLRAIAGLDRATGTVRVQQHCWQDAEHFVPVHRRRVGFVFQEASLFSHLNVKGNLDYAQRRAQAQPAALTFAEVCDLLGLSTLLNRSCAALSGGERQRVAIGRALLSNPHLLLMDEPLTGLDIQRKREVLPFLQRMHRELALPIMYVSHAPDEIARLADNLVLLDNGRSIATGPVNEVLTNLQLQPANTAAASAILDGRITGHDPQYGLSQLEFSGVCLQIPACDLDTDDHVRVRVAARDVSIALSRPADSSILNIVPATIDALTTCDAGQCAVKLNVGDQQLLARITAKSADALQLCPGKAVFAQIKSVALLA